MPLSRKPCKVTVVNIYFSDNDTLRVVTEKNAVDFYIDLQNSVQSSNN